MGKNLDEGEFYNIIISNFAAEKNKRLIHSQQ